MNPVHGAGVPYKRLEGKVVIITGGASGIGECAVRLFHEHGAKVVVADIQDDRGREIADELGDGAIYVHRDVSKEEDVSRAVDAIVYKPTGGVVDATKADLERILGINVVWSQTRR